jgi:hypothetical protein
LKANKKKNNFLFISPHRISHYLSYSYRNFFIFKVKASRKRKAKRCNKLFKEEEAYFYILYTLRYKLNHLKPVPKNNKTQAPKEGQRGHKEAQRGQRGLRYNAGARRA